MRALKNSDERDSSRYDWKSLVFVQKEKKSSEKQQTIRLIFTVWETGLKLPGPYKNRGRLLVCRHYTLAI